MSQQPTACRLLAVILTKNEAHNIAACITSLQGWTDAIIVWDSFSTDATCAIAKKHGAFVVQRPFDNYAAQRQTALDTLNGEWILFLDADERATAELAAEIQARIAQADSPIAGYWLSRRNFIVGHETRGGGFFPDYQLRLLKRGAAAYIAEREVHEIVEVDGEEANLAHPALHDNYQTWHQFHAKQIFYSKYEARILAQRGIIPRPHNFLLQPLREFRRRYITLHGYRDGLHGLKLALLLAWYYGFMPYYWLIWQQRTPKQ